jgi:hypothetical protein
MGGLFPGPAVTAADMAALLAQQTPQVLPGDFTVDTLPAPADNIGKYARVTDLFGVKTDLVLASKSGTMSFWQPVRPVFAAKAAIADMTLTALKSPSVLILDGSVGLGVTRTITLSNSLAFPGASFRFKNRGSLVGALRIGNVNLGAFLSLATGGSQEFYFDATDGWVQVT